MLANGAAAEEATGSGGNHQEPPVVEYRTVTKKATSHRQNHIGFKGCFGLMSCTLLPRRRSMAQTARTRWLKRSMDYRRSAR